MPSLTEWLIKTFCRENRELDQVAVRAQYGFLEAWVSIAGNAVLFVIKISLGLMANSVSLIADAFHTLSDLLSSAVVLVGFRVAKTPPDPRHPYGHGRAEPIGTLIIAMLLVVGAVEFGHVSFDRLLAPEPLAATRLVIYAMVVSILAKEWMARFSNRLAKVIESDMLRADAWHHRSDAIAAGLVLAAAVGAELGYPALDGVFGLGVAAILGLTGFHMGAAMISVLLGEAPDTEVIQGIVDTAYSVRGVRDVHRVAVHDYGNEKHVSLHIAVAPGSSTEESHATADSLEDALIRDMSLAAVVHVDVAGDLETCPTREAVTRVLEVMSELRAEIRGFHGLQSGSDGQRSYADFHLTLDPGMSLAESHRLVHDLSREIIQRTGASDVNIHVEPAEA